MRGVERRKDNDFLLSDPTQDPACRPAVAKLETIEAELTDDKLDTTQKERLRWRAVLIRGMLTPRLITPCRERGCRDQITVSNDDGI